MDNPSASALVVDDNDENRNLLVRRLERKGLQVTEAINGRQALELIQQYNFDLVLLDIMMPVMNGYQVLEALNANAKLRHLPVIVISGIDDLGSVARCIEMGAEDYLFKPFNKTLLNARINASLEKKRLRDQEVVYRQQIEQYNHQLESQLQRNQLELKMARRVQASLLPAELPRLPNWEFAARWLPAHQIAGDFYDIVTCRDGQLGLVVGDVTDKGIPAALFMVFAYNKVHTCITSAQTPAQGIIEANRMICSESSHGLYVSLVYSRIDLLSGEVTYVNAGHVPPLFYCASQARFLPLATTGMALGMDAEATFEQSSLRLGLGDFILFYTDGVQDTLNEAGQPFGGERLLNVIQENARGSALEIVMALEKALEAFRGSTDRFDDTTIVIARRL
jgi:serine phosphatase RsbU (regulator of sigma subunit)